MSSPSQRVWDFADALREKGFIDAIYITGGADYVFSRDKDGIRHDIGDAADYPHTKWKDVVPWLVFRAPKSFGTQPLSHVFVNHSCLSKYPETPNDVGSPLYSLCFFVGNDR